MEDNYNWKDGINDLAKVRQDKLRDLITQKNKQIQCAPEGSLKVLKRGNNNQYYWRKDPGKANGIYIPKEKISLARKLAQKDYDIKVVRAAEKELAALNAYISAIEGSDLLSVYESVNPCRQQLISPVITRDAEYIKTWRPEEYDTLPFDESLTEFYSNNGVKVRSKSELIIANTLEQDGIPYRYEYPLNLNGLGTVRPDFLCLNVRTRKEYIWEHFGMMDNIAYANKNVAKINAYGQNGYITGVNLIMTFETSQHSISSNNIKCMLEKFLH